MLETENQIQEAYANFLKDSKVKQYEILSENANIFEILKAQKFEIRHSNFLAWLLDPKGNHGLGDQILKKILIDLALDNKSGDFSIFSIKDLNFDKVQIHREWFNIDILIQFPDLIIAIENKIGSKENGNQLNIYQDLLRKRFPSKIRKVFVYLNPFGDESTNENYINYSYEIIIRYLSELLELNEAILPKTRIYIEDYIANMKNNIMEDGVKTNLANQIYREHRELIDFIIQNKEDQIYEIRLYLEEKIKEKGWIKCSSTKPILRFLTPELDKIIPKNVSRSWENGEAFLFEVYFYVRKRQIITYATLSPSDKRIKETLFDIVTPVVPKTMKANADWNTFLSKSLDINKFESFTKEGELEEITKEILNRLEVLVNKVEPLLLEKKEIISKLKSISA